MLKIKGRYFNLTPLIFPFVFIYLEFLFRICAGAPTTFRVILSVLLISISIGFLMNVICSFFRKRKTNAWIAFGIVEFFTILYLLIFFVHDAFGVYLSLTTIFKGAGGVAKDFMDNVFLLIVHNIHVILLFELPAIGMLILQLKTKRLVYKRGNLITRAVFVIVFIVLGGLAQLTMVVGANSRAKLTNKWDFANCVESFNVITSVQHDLRYAIFGNPHKGSFVVDDETEPNDETEPTEPVEYGYNVMNIDFDKLIDQTDDSTLQAMHRYVKSLQPTKKNKYTGIFKNKNVILISAEAMSLEAIDPVNTPTLYRMLTKGIQIKEAYQPYWEGSTATGEFSNVLGMVPTDAINSYYQLEEESTNCFMTVGNYYLRNNFTSWAYHNHTSDFYDRQYIYPLYGASQFKALHDGLDITVQWPESDYELMEASVGEYVNKQPFFIYYMTVSGHASYEFDYNAIMNQNYDLVQGYDDASSFVKGYKAVHIELDRGMEYLINELEKAGIADDTLIVMCTDHFPYGLQESEAWGTDDDYLIELFDVDEYDKFVRDHTAIIMWSEYFENLEEPVVVDGPVYSVDILPTILNMCGFEYDSRLLPGRDILSDSDPLVMWPDHSWITDKGYYNMSTERFVPREGVTVSDDYVERMHTIVANKLNYCTNWLNYDYFDIVFNNSDDSIVTWTQGDPLVDTSDLVDELLPEDQGEDDEDY